MDDLGEVVVNVGVEVIGALADGASDNRNKHSGCLSLILVLLVIAVIGGLVYFLSTTTAQ